MTVIANTGLSASTCSTYVILISLSGGAVIIPVLQMRKLRHRISHNLLKTVTYKDWFKTQAV